MKDTIFYKSPTVLTSDLQDFWPLPEQNYAARVNSVVRLIIYTCGIMYIYNRRPVYLAYGVIAICILAYVYASTTNNAWGSFEGFVGAPDPRQCTQPTADNPFMNRLVFDDPNKPPACNPFEVKEDTRKFFNQDLWRNASDVWQKQNSQREYYTMPCTTAIPDTKKFAEFCYGGGGRRLRA